MIHRNVQDDSQQGAEWLSEDSLPVPKEAIRQGEKSEAAAGKQDAYQYKQDSHRITDPADHQIEKFCLIFHRHSFLIQMACSQRHL